MVEFALTASVTLVVLFGLIDFAILFASRITANDAAASAARYAAVNPTSWTNASAPAANTIQGKLLNVAVMATIPNNDSHITIRYVVPGTGSGTECGKYSASSNAFVAENGYTESTCVVAGTLIEVSATYQYLFATPVQALAGLSQSPVTISVKARAIEEL
jgi:Flp pilus assembly protein TadG